MLSVMTKEWLGRNVRLRQVAWQGVGMRWLLAQCMVKARHRMNMRISFPACPNLQVLTWGVLQQLGRYLVKLGSNSKEGQLRLGTLWGQLLGTSLGKPTVALAQQEPSTTKQDSTLVLVVLGTQQQAWVGLVPKRHRWWLLSGLGIKSWR
jgi:hypothetical protein